MKLLKNGYCDYLACVKEIRRDVEKLSIDKEFPHVFFEDLLGQPLDKKIEFYIDLMPNMAQI